MIANFSYPIVFQLTSPFMNLAFNQQIVNSGIYLLRNSGCSIGLTTRSTTDNIPQADGSILHHRFLTGTQMTLAIQMWEEPGDNRPACDTILQEMLDDLLGSFRSLLNAGDNEGRISWDVYGGGGDRMLDDLRLLTYPTVSLDDSGVTEVTVTIDTQYPYALDLTQVVTNVTGTTPVTNAGNADFWPVWQVNASGGSITTFTLLNVTTGLQIQYDSSQPGASAITAGNYAEIDTFKGTIFLNGSGADLSAGIVELNSDDFPLVPGVNSITLTGANANADVLVNNAWA